MAYKINPDYEELLQRNQTADLPLFQQQPEGAGKKFPKWIWDGSGVKAEAYNRIKNLVATNQDALKVLEAIITLGGNATDFEIEEFTGLPINKITARRNDLKELGIITSYPDVKRKGRSNINVTVWFVDYKKLYTTIYN